MSPRRPQELPKRRRDRAKSRSGKTGGKPSATWDSSCDGLFKKFARGPPPAAPWCSLAAPGLLLASFCWPLSASGRLLLGQGA